jgi:hypothetical protein
VADEHSLVIIGYDGDEFVFWDPDSGASSRNGKAGFGKLFFQGGRFTTAETEEELFVNEDGEHPIGANNKRYQVLTVSTG